MSEYVAFERLSIVELEEYATRVLARIFLLIKTPDNRDKAFTNVLIGALNLAAKQREMMGRIEDEE